MENLINEQTSIVLVAAFTFLTAWVSKSKPKENSPEDGLSNQMFAHFTKQIEQQDEKIKALEHVQTKYDFITKQYQSLQDDYDQIKRENDRLRDRVSTLEGKQ